MTLFTLILNPFPSYGQITVFYATAQNRIFKNILAHMKNKTQKERQHD